MYAKFLEDEYGLKVKSNNIIPIKADYPTPSGRDNEGNSIRGVQKTYRQSRPGSNQLEVKNPSADDSKYEQFKGANFQVEREFSLDRCVVMGTAPGVRSGLIDLFPKDVNRETEVSGFRFFVSGQRFFVRK